MSTTTKVVDREYLKQQFKNYDDVLVKPRITDLDNRKVEKITGYGLSKNDFTDALKEKLEGIGDTELEDVDIDFENIDKILVTLVSGNDSELFTGDTITLASDVNGVTWSSSDDSIATVDQNGVVNTVNHGGVNITATKNGYTSGKRSFVVWAGRTTFEGPSTVKVGETITLTAINGIFMVPIIRGDISAISYLVGGNNNNQLIITGVEPGIVTVATGGGEVDDYAPSLPFEITVVPADE